MSRYQLAERDDDFRISFKRMDWGVRFSIIMAFIGLIAYAVRIESRVGTVETRLEYVQGRVDWVIGWIVNKKDTQP